MLVAPFLAVLFPPLVESSTNYSSSILHSCHTKQTEDKPSANNYKCLLYRVLDTSSKPFAKERGVEYVF